jgi:hypothetical protein
MLWYRLAHQQPAAKTAAFRLTLGRDKGPAASIRGVPAEKLRPGLVTFVM